MDIYIYRMKEDEEEEAKKKRNFIKCDASGFVSSICQIVLSQLNQQVYIRLVVSWIKLNWTL